MKVFRIFAVPVIGLTLLAVLVYVFLQREVTPPAPMGPPALHIWADTALRLPMESPDMEHEQGLLGRFQRRTGIRNQITYGDLAQWEDEAHRHRETDLVLTSNPQWKQWLMDEGWLESHTAFAQHIPVILAHESLRPEPLSPTDLRAPDRRLAAADLHGTVLGQLTAALLTNEIYSMDQLQQQVRHVGSTPDDVARAVDQHRADAAIVWKDTALRHARRTFFEPWPDPSIPGPIVYALRLKDSPNSDAAAQLARFLAGPAARDLLHAYGFATVNGDNR